MNTVTHNNASICREVRGSILIINGVVYAKTTKGINRIRGDIGKGIKSNIESALLLIDIYGEIIAIMRTKK